MKHFISCQVDSVPKPRLVPWNWIWRQTSKGGKSRTWPACYGGGEWTSRALL